MKRAETLTQGGQRPRRDRHWRWYINAIVLAAPVWFFYQALNPQFPAAFDQQDLGPFSVQPTPADNDPPYLHDGVWVKDFSFTFCEGCIPRLRQAYVSVGVQPSAAPDGHEGILHGNRHRLHGHVPYPATVTSNDKLWVTVETWDGARYQQSWTLD